MDLYQKLMYLTGHEMVVRKVDDLGYQTFKYHRKVFFNNFWHLDDTLLEARGIVFDKNNKIAQRPFLKIFNLGENGHDLYDTDYYLVSEKINGFMGAVSAQPDESVLYSTTGTTTSDYVGLIKKHVNRENEDMIRAYPEYTFLFEICDETDPHIVEEESGAWLIGARHKESGKMMPLGDLAKIAMAGGFKYKRPFHLSGLELRERAKATKGEGYVVYRGDGIEPVLKIKSPHYLSKKALMRMGRNSVNTMYDHPQKFLQRLDEEFYDLFRWILDNYSKEQWAALSEQERRTVLEEYFDE